jgi:drug/metabolite transporter (DMT)-like permease
VQWISITLLCAFSLASADAATKRFFSDCPPATIVMVRFLGVGLVLFPVLLVQPWPTLPMSFWGWLVVLVPIEVYALLLYMRAISTCELSKTLPYLAFTPVCTVVTGYALLGESVSIIGLAGISLVTLGAYALNIERVMAKGNLRLLNPLRAMIHERGARLMLSVAVLYSVTSVLAKNMLAYAPAMFFGPFYACILATVVLLGLGPTQRQSLTVICRRPTAVLLVALATTLETLTQYLALQLVEVAYMIAVKRTSLLFGIVYGAWIFKEAKITQHLIAALIMVLGMLLIAY